MFCVKICFLEPVGAKLLEVEPEPKKKISGAGAEEKWLGSAATMYLTPRTSLNYTMESKKCYVLTYDCF